MRQAGRQLADDRIVLCALRTLHPNLRLEIDHQERGGGIANCELRGNEPQFVRPDGSARCLSFLIPNSQFTT